MTDYNAMIDKLHEYFYEHGKTKPLEYAFGYFDCLCVIKEILEREKLK